MAKRAKRGANGRGGVGRRAADAESIPSSVPELCDAIRDRQRERVWYIKSRNMIDNRLRATVAGLLGYSSRLSKDERIAIWRQAREVVDAVAAGEPHQCAPMVRSLYSSFQTLDAMIEKNEKRMCVLASRLPTALWIEQPEQRGVGLLTLAIIVGECGDLANYPNPGKLWRRMACAPFEKNGVVLMGATWKVRKESPKLSREEWEKFGYSPRRRSIAYLIGENIVKGNFMPQDGDGTGENVLETESRRAGPYRLRYLETKQRAAEKHPEWLACSKCNGAGRVEHNGKARKCGNCKGTGQVWMHCHRHGMLLATKLLLKNLWIEWNEGGEGCCETDTRSAARYATGEEELEPSVA